MPPANSPVHGGTPVAEQTRSPTPAYVRSALRDLASPVPDYASTLGLQAEDQIDADNVSFIRTPLAPEDEVNADNLDRRIRDERRRRQQQHMDTRQRERERNQADSAQERQLQAHRAELIRQRHLSQEMWAETMTNRTQNATQDAYGSRVPHEQSMYDWAPASLETDEEELRQLMAHMREEQPETHPEVVRAIATANYQSRRHTGARESTNRSSFGQQEASLRSAAILQSVSRNWRFSTRSRALMSRYILDREQRALEAERAQQQRTAAAAATLLPEPLSDALRQTQNGSPWPAQLRNDAATPIMGDADRDSATLDSLRRRYLENPLTKVTEFEKIIKYLHSLRSSDLGPATRAQRHVPHEAKPQLLRGLQMDEAAVKRMHNVRPHRSSWLIPGMTFTGQQRAAPVSLQPPTRSSGLRPVHGDHQPNVLDAQDVRPSTLAPLEPWLGRSMTSTPQPLSALPSPSLSTDSWTVKVALHSVDYDTMTLQGTMEAFNVPSYTSQTSMMSASNNNKTTFSTFVEGELIDFDNHTLLTESERHFAKQTTPDIDAAYWRKLEPFTKLSDEQIAHALLDKAWVERELMGKYVLMRWKERCFVRPTYTSFSNLVPSSHDAGNPWPVRPQTTATTSFMPGADGNGYGLSISGFYYVSLRRSDGHCEGLYFDPQSSPYQRLELKPVLEGSWGSGAWEMR